MATWQGKGGAAKAKVKEAAGWLATLTAGPGKVADRLRRTLFVKSSGLGRSAPRKRESTNRFVVGVGSFHTQTAVVCMPRAPSPTGCVVQ